MTMRAAPLIAALLLCALPVRADQSDEATDKDATSVVIFQALKHVLAHRYDVAVREYGIAIARSPGKVELYFLRCNARLLAASDYAGALADCDRAIQLDSKQAEYFGKRAEVYRGLHRYEEAVADYDRALDLDPGLFRGALYRCQIRAEWGRELDQAEDDCAAYLADSGGGVEIHEAWALLGLRRGRNAQTIDQSSLALAMDAKRAPSLYMRGLAKLRLGDKDGGNADIAAAKAIDPTVAGTYAGYGLTP